MQWLQWWPHTTRATCCLIIFTSFWNKSQPIKAGDASGVKYLVLLASYFDWNGLCRMLSLRWIWSNKEVICTRYFPFYRLPWSRVLFVLWSPLKRDSFVFLYSLCPSVVALYPYPCWLSTKYELIVVDRVWLVPEKRFRRKRKYFLKKTCFKWYYCIIFCIIIRFI